MGVQDGDDDTLRTDSSMQDLDIAWTFSEQGKRNAAQDNSSKKG
jgi:hypothetical protein